MRKSIIKNSILSGLLIITGFLSLEFVARAIYPKRIARLTADRKPFVQKSEIEGLYYELTPNYDEVSDEKDSKGHIVRSVRYQINKDGIRDCNYPKEKKNAFRIICLGDSFTFGYGVDLKYTYPKILEKELNKIYSENYEVINAGFPGYNTCQELILLKEKLIQYNPDLVIVGFCLNDTDPSFKLDAEKGLVLVSPRPSPFYLKIPTFLMQKSHFINVTVNIFKSFFTNLLSKKGGAWAYDLNSRNFTKGKLKDIIEITRNRNIKLIIVLTPYPGYTKISKGLPNQLLENFYKKNNTSFLDLTSFFREKEIKSGTKLFFCVDGHPNSIGHSVISEVILKEYL